MALRDCVFSLVMKSLSSNTPIALVRLPTTVRARARRLLSGPVCAFLAFGLAGGAWAANIGPEGSGIMGFNDAIDADAGTSYYQAGFLTHINDGLLGTRVDNWSNGNDLGQNVSFVGVLWPSPRFEQITKLTLTLATFYDGGWFGYANSGPGWGGTIYAVSDLLEPTVQVTTDGGVNWTTVDRTSDYMTALDGHGIGGTGDVNPTSATAVFTLALPATQINGIRIIGENGGTADGNGFLGVYELVVEGGNRRLGRRRHARRLGACQRPDGGRQRRRRAIWTATACRISRSSRPTPSPTSATRTVTDWTTATK